MKTLLLSVALFLISFSSFGQFERYIKPNNSYGFRYNRMYLDSALTLTYDTLSSAPDGSIAWLDHEIWVKDTTWKKHEPGGEAWNLQKVLEQGSSLTTFHNIEGNDNVLAFTDFGTLAFGADNILQQAYDPLGITQGIVNIESHRIELRTNNSGAGKSSIFKVQPDSIVASLTNGVFRVRGIAEGPGVKALRYDPSTGEFTFADTTAGGGTTIDFENGITESGAIAKLGGALTENTLLTGRDYDLSFGDTDDRINSFNVNARNGVFIRDTLKNTYTPSITLHNGSVSVQGYNNTTYGANINTFQSANLNYITSPNLILEGTTSITVNGSVPVTVDTTNNKPIVRGTDGIIRQTYWPVGEAGDVPPPAPKQVMHVSVVDEWDYSGNMRNEEATILLLNPDNPDSDTFDVIYNRFANNPGDIAQANIYMKRTYDGGRTWVDSVELYGGNDRNYWVSAYQSPTKDTQFINFVNLHPSPDQLMVMYRTRTGPNTWTSWSTPTTGFSFPLEPVARGNTVVQDWKKGRGYLMAVGLEVSGTNSVNGVRDGLLLHSNDGITWTNPIGDVIKVRDSSCIEAYVVIDNEGTGYKFLWRSARSDSVQYFDIAEDFSDYGPDQKWTGLKSPNACHHMIYDTISGQYFYAGNRITHKINYAILDGNDRHALDIWSTRNMAEKGWTPVLNMAEEKNRYFIQPTLTILGQRLLFNYSKGEDIAGGFPYSLYLGSVPLSVVYDRNVPLYSNSQLIVSSVPDWYWDITSRPYIHTRIGWASRPFEQAGLYFISPNAVNTRTGIEMHWYGDSTTLGFKQYIQKWTDGYFQPSIQWNFKIRGYNVGSGFAYPNYEVLHSYIRHANTIDTTTQIFADGRIETIGRIMPGSATTSQINAFLAPTRKAGQIIWNSDSTRLAVYNGSAWKYLAYTTDAGGGGGGIALGDLSAVAPLTYDDNTGEFSTSMSSGKLIGRSTAGTGVMEEISIGDGLLLSGGTLSATSSGGIEGSIGAGQIAFGNSSGEITGSSALTWNSSSAFAKVIGIENALQIENALSTSYVALALKGSTSLSSGQRFQIGQNANGTVFFTAPAQITFNTIGNDNLIIHPSSGYIRAPFGAVIGANTTSSFTLGVTGTLGVSGNVTLSGLAGTTNRLMYLDASEVVQTVSTSPYNVLGPIATKTDAYTLTATDFTILVDATTAGFTITLPPASSVPGKPYLVKKIDATSNTVNVDGDGSETIDGTGHIDLLAQWDWVMVQSTGSQWIIIGKSN